MNILLVCFLIFNPIDTLKINYLPLGKDSIWQSGYLVAKVSQRNDVYLILDEPYTWLNSKKEPIEKPKKYHLEF